jgi:hypothetical protein
MSGIQESWVKYRCGSQRDVISMYNHSEITQGESVGRKRQEYCSNRREGIYF